ncbi:MAG: GTP-binding protein [Promethearchaeota archaeon]
MSEYDYLFKVIVVGDGAVGKTAITIRFAEGRFEEHYKMTIGVDFAIKLIEVQGYRVKLQVWDTGGQERFSYIRPLYYKGAMAALAIFDLTNRESYDNLSKWFQEVADNCGAIPLMLVGNKADLPDRAVESSEAKALADQLSIDYFEASAKNGKNINLLFFKLGELLLQAKVPALATAPAPVETPTTPISTDISPPPTVPTISPPPTIPTFTAPPKPPTITPPTVPPVVTPTLDTSPSLDEALKILEGTEEPIIEPEDITPEPVEFTPPMPKPVEIVPPTPEPVVMTPPEPKPVEITPPKPIDITPPEPKPIEITPPPPEPVDLTPSTPEPIDLTPPDIGPPPIDVSPPTPETAPLETQPPTPDATSSFIPFSAASSTTSISSTSSESRAVFVPFTLGGPTTAPRPSAPSGSTGGSWIDFMRSAPKTEEKKAAFVPFMTTIKEEPEEIILEVVPKEKEEKATKEIICPGCNRKISAAWKFCTYCGATLV